MNQAFILGAGLGTRLRPLTDRLPKPLVPLFHRPLSEWAMRACAAAGATRFAINTHHLPEAWGNFRPDGISDITLFHEPVLLETGGGLKNIERWMSGKPVLVHNGDIFSTLPLHQLVAAHEASGLPVTLAVRSTGIATHIALNEIGDRVIDIRNLLGKSDGSHVFTGIYCVSPEFLDLIPANEKISVIPAFLELAKQGKLGAIVLDDGVWLDLGDRTSYLQAHHELALQTPIHPTATIGAGVHVEATIVGANATIAAGAFIKNSVLWPGATIAADAHLEGCIVFSENLISGAHTGEDL